LVRELSREERAFLSEKFRIDRTLLPSYFILLVLLPFLLYSNLSGSPIIGKSSPLPRDLKMWEGGTSFKDEKEGTSVLTIPGDQDEFSLRK
jgi:hypothetical protein